MQTRLLHPNLAGTSLPSNRPLRILFLTSLRDVALCDHNGEMIATRDGARYMQGLIEHTALAAAPGGDLHGQFHIAGVITDDRPKDLHGYRPLPDGRSDWLWPTNLDLPTWNIPSEFRGLGRDQLEARAAGKLAFETEVYRLFQKLEADIIVSDHYMARIEFLITSFGLYGLVLNIHPAITQLGHRYCLRGPTPTADAIRRAQSEPMQTGATLHLVNDVIDDGPILAFSEGTPVHADDDPQALRYRNYQTAKLPLFITGLQHYRRLVTAG